MDHKKEIKVTKLKDGSIKIETIISNKKINIRKVIENIEDGKKYDIYDIVADLANAVNDLIPAELETKSINKYRSRQKMIKNQISKSYEK